MSEYLPLNQEDAITRVASATIVGGQLVVVTGSGTVGPASVATAAWVGVAGFDCNSGDSVTVYTDVIQRCIAVGTVTAGQLVECAAGGGVATHTNGTNDFNVVGLALTTATNPNTVEVQMLR